MSAEREEPKDWLIFSFDHMAWWRPDSAGYTGKVAEAGHYTATEYCRIAERSDPREKPKMPIHISNATDDGWPGRLS
jgi:hypothetical protein